jgi:hypothetical protein
MAILSKTITLQNQNTLDYIFLKNGDWQPKNVENTTILQASSDKVVFNKVILLIQNAKEIICLQSFLIQDTAIIDELIKATERGIRVFITSSVEARLKPTIEEEESFIKENYKKMLNEKFKFHFVHRSAESFHAKFIIIDGKTNPQGIIFTNNFTENGFFKNPELAVVLTKEQAQELYKVFVYYFWERTTDEQTAEHEFESVKPLGKFELPNLQHILLSTDKSLKKAVVQAIEKAENEIALSTFTIDSEYEISKAIVTKQQKKVALTIFTRLNNKQLQSHVKRFTDKKADVFLHPTTHAKFILIDNTEGYIFTANFNQSDFEVGFNVGLKLSKQQVLELSTIIQSWKSKMPYEWLNAQSISLLSEYWVFENEKLVNKKVELVKVETEKKQVKTVEDFIGLFKKQRNFADNSFQRQELTLSADLEDFKGDLTDNETYDVQENGNVKFVTEFEKMGSKDKKNNSVKVEKRKFVLISPNENVENSIKIIDNKDNKKIGHYQILAGSPTTILAT